MSSTSCQRDAIAKLRLPRPYLTTYYILPSDTKSGDGDETLQIQLAPEQRADSNSTSHPELHNKQLSFTDPQKPKHRSPPISDNTEWARAQRSFLSEFVWDGESTPELGQIWLAIYAILTMQPDLETFRITMNGSGSEQLKARLKHSTLAIDIPSPKDQSSTTQTSTNEILILRSTFWQGAGSPFGPRSPWTPSSSEFLDNNTTLQTLTTKFPDSRVHSRHPLRPQKPTPGTVVYSRYIASLDEEFSLIALDHENEEHVNYFHTWQNDPRVAKGWNETGTLAQHREYLRKQHVDPHTFAVLGRFNGVPFSYFEIFYTKEDHVGAYYDAHDYDRGRHSLVGDAKLRGPQRVLAWWSCIIHYCFLDNPRTEFVIGEPVATNATVLAYDYMHGLHVDRFIDFPHKRAALVKVSRERFFQVAPLSQKGGFIAGTRVPLPAKL